MPVVLAVIILVNGFAAVVTVHADAIRSFAAMPCDHWITLTRLAGHQVTCGFVTVPESHARPDGPTIRLAVVQISASHPERGLAPLFYLAGGPGGPGITPGWAGATAAQLATDRDYVTFDQRGVGYSQPNLECTEPTPSMPAGSSADAVEARRLALYAACRDRFVRQGVDLTAYNSTESAADIEDIRIALGYDQINLLGISYGTRLALTMMRDFPASLHSVIIDSVSPLQEDSYL